jgi:tRNA A37 N6-isopentenylltransferase MiaA
MTSDPVKALLIAGPTASGKPALAPQLMRCFGFSPLDSR